MPAAAIHYCQHVTEVAPLLPLLRPQPDHATTQAPKRPSAQPPPLPPTTTIITPPHHPSRP